MSKINKICHPKNFLAAGLVVLDNCLSDISHDQPWDNEAT
jgi:hypothetical protein